MHVQIVVQYDTDDPEKVNRDVVFMLDSVLPYMADNVGIKISEPDPDSNFANIYNALPIPSPLEPFLRAAIEEQDRQIEAQLKALMMLGGLTLDEVLETWILDIEQVETPEALTYADDFDNMSVQWRPPYRYTLRKKTKEELEVFDRIRVDAAKNAVKVVRALDPKPWVYGLLPVDGDAQDPDNPNLAREAEQVTGGFAFFPRKQYEQDPRKYPSYVKYHAENDLEKGVKS